MSTQNGKDASPFLPEDTVLADKWIILGHIATGGKGEVYLARQKNLDREVAIKIISPEFLSMLEEHAEDLETEIQRFRREVLIMARIRHPNILQIYDFDEVEYNGQRLEFIVMEYIPGSTLRLTMSDEGFANSPKDLLDWICDYFFPILSGMSAIHAQGIVHRDMKPENILLDGKIPKITDFGLSGGKWLDNVTRSHHILGTMPYMPREQFLDLPLSDARADVYALGKILFEAVEGKMNEQKACLMKTASLENPDTLLLRRLDRIIRQATAEDRNKRTPSIDAMHKDLKRLVELQDTHESRASGRLSTAFKHNRFWILVASIFFCLFAGVLWLHLNMQTDQIENTATERIAPDSRLIEAAEGNQPALTSPTITGDDGAVLKRIEGGSIIHYNPATNQPLQMRIHSFYMETTEVTNHQYVEFLNANKSQIHVNNEVVYGDNEAVWLLLGAVMENYEPIVYKREANRFTISKASYAAHPVVRVTPQGAEAYAAFYGRRLPKAAEWHFAGKKKTEKATGRNGKNRPQALSGGISNPASVNNSNADLPAEPSPFSDPEGLRAVGDLPPNDNGIRGMDANAMEWVIGMDKKNQYTKYYILGRPGIKIENRVHPIPRKPWEAFENVGFRTVLDPQKE